MPFTGPAEDRMLIRELYDAYADGANRGSRTDWLAGFAEDAVWKSHYFECCGISAIAAKYDEIMDNVADTTFFTQLGSIEVAGDKASVRAFCAESLLMKTGGTYELTGEYNDKLERRNGAWRFVYRDYLVKREKLPG